MDSESFDLSIKTLKGEMFQVNVNPSDSIKEVKQKIQALKGFDAGQIKLVCQGKLLDKAEFSLTEYNIKKTDFLVVMVPKVKAPPKKPDAPKPATSQPTTASSSNTNPPATGPAAPAAASSSGAAATTASNVPKQANQLATGPQLEAVIKGIQDMGFARDDIKIALRAAYNNPDRAVQYLMSGVPTHILEEQAQAAQAHRAAAAGGGGAAAAAAAGQSSAAAGGGNALPSNFPQQFQDLVNNPMFQQLRQRVMQDPNFLQQIMGQLQQSDPALYNAINQNPMQFMQLLLAGGGQGGGGGGGSAAGRHHPPGTIQITLEEKQAIDRLQALGFEKVRAAQAYFACDKNEQMAANFLFQNATMDDKYFAGEDVGDAPAGSAPPAPPEAPAAANPEPVPAAAPAAQNSAPPQPIEEPKDDDVPEDQQNNKQDGDDEENDKPQGSAFD